MDGDEGGFVAAAGPARYQRTGEIAETGMFAPGDVPGETDTGTLCRLGEIFDGAPLSAKWSA